jgi:hypothetical protein
MVKPSANGNLQSFHIAKLLSAFHCVCNPINVIASFRNAGIGSQLGEDGTSMAGVDTEAHRCLLPSDMGQNDPDALVEIEDEESDTFPILLWPQLLEAEAAALLDESE